MTSSGAHLRALTGLRIIAALWVALMHFREITPNLIWRFPGSYLDSFLSHGGLGVDLFFVLSGFILSHVYFATFSNSVRVPEALSFIWKRFCRLYPVHLITFGMMVFLFVVERVLLGGSGGQDGRFSWGVVVSTLTMTHAWIPGLLTPNLPAWSISAEWFAYLTFPLVCLLVARSRYGTVLVLLGGLALATISAETTNNSLVHVSGGFLVGVAAFQVARRVDLSRYRFLGVLSTVLLIFWVLSPLSPHTEISVPIFALLVVALASTSDWLSLPLGTRLMVYLGEISYAFYMFHWVARVVVRAGVERFDLLSRIPLSVVVLLYLLLGVVGAILIFHLVEKPARRYLQRFDPGKRVGASSKLEPHPTSRIANGARGLD